MLCGQRVFAELWKSHKLFYVSIVIHTSTMKVSDLESTREVVTKYEPVILTGTEDSYRTRAKVDTAANRSNIGELALESIGKSNYNGDTDTIVGEESEDRETFELCVDLLNIEGARIMQEVNVKDRTNFGGNFLIGRDILNEFDLVVDPTQSNFDGNDDIEEMK